MKRLTVVLLVLYLLVLVAALPVAAQEPESKQIVIPDDLVEFSALTGFAFPEGVLAGCVSIKAAQTASGRAIFWADVGGSFNAGEVGLIVGGSTNLGVSIGDVKTRLGLGAWWKTLEFGKPDVVLYTRLAF